MCGVFGIASQNDGVASLTYLGLFALQHRGQEGAGMAVSNEGKIYLHKAMGTIDWVFRRQIPLERRVDFIRSNCDMPRRDLIEEVAEFERRQEEEVLEGIRGRVSIGHVLYSTTGASGNKNIHPILFYFKGESACVAHNGNIIGLKKLREIVKERGGYNFEGTTDTELIAALIATSSQSDFYSALLETLPLLNGAFSLVFLHNETVYAVKDKFAIRPLCVGRTEDSYIVASETNALDLLKAEFLKELGPGEGVILRPGSIKDFKWCDDGLWRSCIFDHGVYFSRPDSHIRGRSAKETRVVSGRLLARAHPVFHADIVIPVPDSGNAPAEGYAEESSIPLCNAIIRSHFTGRTFIQPVVRLRYLYRGIKYNPIQSDVEGMVVVVVDDSIVRGTTMPYIVKLLKDAGAKEVHVRVAAAPLREPCFLGVDLPWRKDYIANKIDESGNIVARTVEEIRQEIEKLAGVKLDSLAYLSLDDLIRATGLPASSWCTGCFDRNWPVSLEEDDYNPKSK
ncbi:MAG: amidophosphoribosyltransferase [Candidatus Spechtbacterales bacterium]